MYFNWGSSWLSDMRPDAAPAAWSPWIKPPFHWSCRQHTGHGTLQSNWAGAEEMRRFIFIGSEGKEGPSPRWPQGLKGPLHTRHARAGFPMHGKPLPTHFTVCKNIWSWVMTVTIFWAEWRALNSTGVVLQDARPSRTQHGAGRTINTAGSIFYMQLLTHKLQYISSHFDNSWGPHLPPETPAGPIMRIINNIC